MRARNISLTLFSDLTGLPHPEFDTATPNANTATCFVASKSTHPFLVLADMCNTPPGEYIFAAWVDGQFAHRSEFSHGEYYGPPMNRHITATQLGGMRFREEWDALDIDEPPPPGEVVIQVARRISPYVKTAWYGPVPAADLRNGQPFWGGEVIATFVVKYLPTIHLAVPGVLSDREWKRFLMESDYLPGRKPTLY